MKNYKIKNSKISIIINGNPKKLPQLGMKNYITYSTNVGPLKSLQSREVGTSQEFVSQFHIENELIWNIISFASRFMNFHVSR